MDPKNSIDEADDDDDNDDAEVRFLLALLLLGILKKTIIRTGLFAVLYWSICKKRDRIEVEVQDAEYYEYDFMHDLY